MTVASYDKSVFNFYKKPQTHLSKWLHPFAFCATVGETAFCSTFCWPFGILCVPHSGHADGNVVIPYHVALICVFLITWFGPYFYMLIFRLRYL